MAKRRMYRTLGKALKVWRNGHGVKQETLASDLGISRKTLSRIEQGHEHPSSATMNRIHEVTHLVEDFHFENNNSTKNRSKRKAKRSRG